MPTKKKTIEKIRRLPSVCRDVIKQKHSAEEAMLLLGGLYDIFSLRIHEIESEVCLFSIKVSAV